MMRQRAGHELLELVVQHEARMRMTAAAEPTAEQRAGQRRFAGVAHRQQRL